MELRCNVLDGMTLNRVGTPDAGSLVGAGEFEGTGCTCLRFGRELGGLELSPVELNQIVQRRPVVTGRVPRRDGIWGKRAHQKADPNFALASHKYARSSLSSEGPFNCPKWR